MSDRQLPPIAKELIAAKKRIENEDDWCQGQFQNGHRVCAATALCEASESGNAYEWFIASALLLRPRITCVSELNDEVGHKAVMETFDHAIARAIAKGK